MRKTNIAGIILAAGKSTRMGEMKQNIKLDMFENRSFLDEIIFKFRKCLIKDIFIVTGFNKDLVIESSIYKNDKNIHFIYNKDYDDEQKFSYITAANHINSNEKYCDEFTHFSINLVDHPFFNYKSLNNLINKIDENIEKKLFFLRYLNKKGHPFIIQKRQFFRVLNLQTGETMKDVTRIPEESCFLETDDFGVVADIDDKKILNETIDKLNIK